MATVKSSIRSPMLVGISTSRQANSTKTTDASKGSRRTQARTAATKRPAVMMNCPMTTANIEGPVMRNPSWVSQKYRLPTGSW